jgi:WD40 repeat protein
MQYDFYMCCGSDFDGPGDGAVARILHPSLTLLAQVNSGAYSDFGTDCQIVASTFANALSSLFVASLPIRKAVVAFKTARRNKNHALQRDSRLKVGSFVNTGSGGQGLTLEVLQWVITGSTHARGNIASMLLRKYEITLPTSMGECSMDSVCCLYSTAVDPPADVKDGPDAASAIGTKRPCFLFCAVGRFVGCWRIPEYQIGSGPDSTLEKGWWLVKDEALAAHAGDNSSVITCLSYSQITETLVIGYKDGSLELWKLPLATLSEQYQANIQGSSVSFEIGESCAEVLFGAHNGGVNSIAHAPVVDANGFFSCGEDGCVRHWSHTDPAGPCEEVGSFSQKLMAPKREYGDTDNFMPIPRFLVPALFLTKHAQNHVLLTFSAGSICLLDSISPAIQKRVAETENDILNVCSAKIDSDSRQAADDILVLSKRNKVQIFTLSRGGNVAMRSRVISTAAKRSVGVVQKEGVEKQKGRIAKKSYASSNAHGGRSVAPGQFLL